MFEVQEVVERTNSPTFCWRSTKKGSFSTYMYGCIFHSFSLWYNSCNDFCSETAVDRLANPQGPPVVRGSQFEKKTTLSLRK
jgi:hypothetical protein